MDSSTDPRHRLGSRPGRVPSCAGRVPLAWSVAPDGKRCDSDRHTMELSTELSAFNCRDENARYAIPERYRSGAVPGVRGRHYARMARLQAALHCCRACKPACDNWASLLQGCRPGRSRHALCDEDAMPVGIVGHHSDVEIYAFHRVDPHRGHCRCG